MTDAEAPPPCPHCGSARVAALFWGYPGNMDALAPALASGAVALGGCAIMDDGPLPNWRCHDCHHEFAATPAAPVAE